MLINKINLKPVPEIWKGLAEALDSLGFDLVIKDPGGGKMSIRKKDDQKILWELSEEYLEDNGIDSIIENIKNI